LSKEKEGEGAELGAYFIFFGAAEEKSESLHGASGDGRKVRARR